MQILNIAGYKFLPLGDTETLRDALLSIGENLGLKGTILLSKEGMNINLAGTVNDITAFKQFIANDARFSDLTFRESFSATPPFDFLKIKIKKEIITMKRPELTPEKDQAPAISPQEFKQWLDEQRDITLVDTRNEYEIRFGSFHHAQNLEINDFSEFPEAAKKISREKPVVMFCTGGIRCEKAALHLLQEGFPEVYQLQGGILNYFAEVGGAHYDGECFVFDQRVAVDANLQVTGTQQCVVCEGPMKAEGMCERCG